MPRCQRLPTLGLCLALGLLLSACDPKPMQPTAGTPPSSGESPTGIKPADSGDKVEASSAHKGPSEGGTAIGGMSGPNGGGAAGGTPAPSGGDGSAPK